ncbi:MAG: homoserine O-acetyltransferase [Proteobacteria bacterium]|nr:homoserine O-acetyltransferase [Pseudomonadota bacterium]MBU1390048.1 homoserine O-acetyltransferase [Pseudomonadota bacterium]MBU1545001.1 homoserine O-acetyltransferase [Pseudomonadota bacterium]MBU2480395.1 homoserine O-acetyltransferase [Pseudomonadota bacterium]
MSEYTQSDPKGISVGIVEKQFFTFAKKSDPLKLESGASLGPVTLAYETCGTLNSNKSNVILVLHALSGDSHMAGYYTAHDARPGWWDLMIGPGKGIDTDKYFVICSNIVGSCAGSTGPASIDPETRKEYATHFPLITIGDMVEAQKALMDHLNITSILSAIGGSVGGMQVLEWCIRYPAMIRSAIPLATTTRHSALAIAFNEVARQSIMADPNWNQGHYYNGKKPDIGLALARMIGHITYLSDESMRLKFGRKLQNRSALSFEFGAEFQVESYLQHQGNKFIERFDANSFLYITKAADYFDLAEQYGNGSLVDAFSKCRAKFLVVSYTSDWLYPTYQSKEMVKAMKKNNLDVSFCEIESQWGHDAFLLPGQRLENLIRGFLRSISNDN